MIVTPKQSLVDDGNQPGAVATAALEKENPRHRRGSERRRCHRGRLLREEKQGADAQRGS